MEYAVAITGASGSIYGIRLLQSLPGKKMLIVSKTAKEIIPSETGMSVEEVYGLADEVFEDDDLFCPSVIGKFQIRLSFCGSLQRIVRR